MSLRRRRSKNDRGAKVKAAGCNGNGESRGVGEEVVVAKKKRGRPKKTNAKE